MLTPFVVATGVSWRRVLRGFVTDGSGAGPARPGHRDWHLAPEIAASSSAGLPAGQLGSVEAWLVPLGDLYNAFVFATDESPDAGASIRRSPPA